VEHTQESKALTSTRVGPTLARVGSVATRRATTDGGEVGEGGEEARRWPGKPKKNRSSLDQIESKTPNEIRTNEKAMIG
jgi:hypothetical protein